MPYRGRDTFYVESLIAWCNVAAGLLCIFVKPPVWETNILTLFVSIAPIELWAVIWIFVGASQFYGFTKRSLKWVEYGAVVSAALWIVVTVNVVRSGAGLYPMTCIFAPTLAFYSGLVYFYQARTAAHNYGRSAQTARG
jgi:hypothetical protein